MTYFENNFTWQGFLDSYDNETNTIELYNDEPYCTYDIGKTKLFVLVLNKLSLFFGLLTLLLFLAEITHIKKSYVGLAVLFLLFDIFIDETTVCIPLCKLLDNLEKGVPSIKIDISFSIEIQNSESHKNECHKNESEKSVIVPTESITVPTENIESCSLNIIHEIELQKPNP